MADTLKLSSAKPIYCLAQLGLTILLGLVHDGGCWVHVLWVNTWCYLFSNGVCSTDGVGDGISPVVHPLMIGKRVSMQFVWFKCCPRLSCCSHICARVEWSRDLWNNLGPAYCIYICYHWSKLGGKIILLLDCWMYLKRVTCEIKIKLHV